MQHFPPQPLHLKMLASWTETCSVRLTGREMNAFEVIILTYRRTCTGTVRSASANLEKGGGVITIKAIIDGQIIEQVQTFKSLGNTIDN